MSDEIREAVRERYRRAAGGEQSCCGGAPELSPAGGATPAAAGAASCCGGNARSSNTFGYTFDELAGIPAGADLALGCGNPTALASLVEGETVVDLGSGAGIDCFLAARRVGPRGRVIGVDMTAEMISRARRFAAESGYDTVEFRLGEIEHLPIADGLADLVISNCVINLSPDKASVFGEALRVLKPGGRMVVSDVVLTESLPPELAQNVALLTGCIAGAAVEADYLALIRAVGFDEVTVESRTQYATREHLEGVAGDAAMGRDAAAHVAAVTRSVTVRAVKPAG